MILDSGLLFWATLQFIYLHVRASVTRQYNLVLTTAELDTGPFFETQSNQIHKYLV